MESFGRVSGQSDGFACTRNVNFGDLWRSNPNFEVNVVHLNIDQEVILNILTPRSAQSDGITCTRNVNFGDLWRSKLNFEVNVVHLNIDQEVILSILHQSRVDRTESRVQY